MFRRALLSVVLSFMVLPFWLVRADAAPPRCDAVTVSVSPLPVGQEVQVGAVGCPRNFYLNLDAIDSHGITVFALGGPAADGSFGPVGWVESSAGPVRFEVRGSRIGPDGYPSGFWRTLASLDTSAT